MIRNQLFAFILIFAGIVSGVSVAKEITILNQTGKIQKVDFQFLRYDKNSLPEPDYTKTFQVPSEEKSVILVTPMRNNRIFSREKIRPYELVWIHVNGMFIGKIDLNKSEFKIKINKNRKKIFSDELRPFAEILTIQPDSYDRQYKSLNSIFDIETVESQYISDGENSESRLEESIVIPCETNALGFVRYLEI